MRPLLALSVRQPWAHAIVHLRKEIENRPRRHRHRGLLLIHASAGMTGEEYDAAQNFMHARGVLGGHLPDRDVIDRGGIIGAVDVVDSVTESDSPWWMGPCGLVLTRPRPIPFIACKGTVAPLIWVPPAEVQDHCARSLGL